MPHKGRDQDSRECATGGTKVSLAAFLWPFFNAAPLKTTIMAPESSVNGLALRTFLISCYFSVEHVCANIGYLNEIRCV